MPFTSKGQLGRHRGKSWREKPMILGYRLPDYGSTLHVSDCIATDYFTRMVAHDLGHGFLPSISPEYESLHNVSMLYATHFPEEELTEPWERMIKVECTNPFFFLQASPLIHAVQTDDPLKKHIAKKYQSWYVIKPRYWTSREQQLRMLWGITPEMDYSDASAQVVHTIQEMTHNGFAKYQ